jgi:hypothetical protein
MCRFWIVYRQRKFKTGFGYGWREIWSQKLKNQFGLEKMKLYKQFILFNIKIINFINSFFINLNLVILAIKLKR